MCVSPDDFSTMIVQCPMTANSADGVARSYLCKNLFLSVYLHADLSRWTIPNAWGALSVGAFFFQVRFNCMDSIL